MVTIAFDIEEDMEETLDRTETWIQHMFAEIFLLKKTRRRLPGGSKEKDSG